MDQRLFEVFPKSDSLVMLRLRGSNGQLIGDRQLVRSEVQAFITEVEQEYRKSIKSLHDLGRRLYDWLDGPTERWLAQARANTTGLTLHVAVEERLRHLPWELLFDGGAFLC